jgi:hypothetical protein
MINYIRIVNPTNYQLISMRELRVTLQVKYFNYFRIRLGLRFQKVQFKITILKCAI